MTKYLIEWTNTRKVYTEVEAKDEKDAIKQAIEGKGIELDWSGSAYPQSKEDIISIKKGDE